MAQPIPQLKDGEQTVFFRAGGEWCYLRTPSGYRANPAQGSVVPCVIHCHGNGGYVRDGEADWLDDENKSIVVRMLVDAGIAVGSSHATGNHWGTTAAVAANAALFDALVGEAHGPGGEARVAAGLVLRRALEHEHRGALLPGGEGGAEGGVAAADDKHIHEHIRVSRFSIESAAASPYDLVGPVKGERGFGAPKREISLENGPGSCQ